MYRVSEDIKTGIVSLKVESHEPELAQAINFAFIEELEKYQQNYIKKNTSNTKKFITGRIQDIEKDLNNAEEKLKDFTSRNRRMDNSALLLLSKTDFKGK